MHEPVSSLSPAYLGSISSLSRRQAEAGAAEAPWWVVRLVEGTKTAFTTTVPEAAALPARCLTIVDGCRDYVDSLRTAAVTM